MWAGFISPYWAINEEQADIKNAVMKESFRVMTSLRISLTWSTSAASTLCSHFSTLLILPSLRSPVTIYMPHTIGFWDLSAVLITLLSWKYGISHPSGFPSVALGLLCFLWMALLAWTPLEPIFPKILLSGNRFSHSTYSAWIALSAVLMSTVTYTLKKPTLSPALPRPSFGLIHISDCCAPYNKATPTLDVPENLYVNMRN